ncbi:MAG: oligosaccharide flippase family protein [Myxococcales bacterium]|jgi:O-antigen/teichoic acid export membrane protein
MTTGLRRGFVVLTLAQVSFVICGYATHVLLARKLGPAAYGTYGVVLSVLSTVALVLNGGLPEAIAKFAAERPQDADGIFARGIAIQFRFSLLLALAFAAASPVIGMALHDHALAPVLAASALAVPPIALYAVVVGAFNGQHRFTAQALAVGGYGVLRAGLVIGLALRYEISGAVVGFVLSPLVVVGFALPGILRRRTTSRLDARALWVFARPVIGFTIALSLLMGFDLFVVKALVRDADLVGYYAAATTISKVPYFVFSTLGVVLLPIVSSAGSDADGSVLLVARNAIRLIFAVALGVASVGAPFSHAVLSTLYGERYSVAALPLGLLLIAMTLFTLTFIVAYTLNGLGQPGLGQRLTMIGVVLELVVAVVLTPLFGPSGAAAASCLTSVALLVALLHYAKPYLGVVFAYGSLLRVGLACIATLAMGFALPHVRPLHLLYSLPLALGYCALLVLSREISVQQVRGWARRERG